MKKKKILLIVLPIILIIIAIAVAIILYFTTDMFKSNEQLFSKYFVQNADIFSVMENENTKIQEEFKRNNTYTMEGNLTTTMQMTGGNAQEIKATTASRHDSQTGRTYSEITLKNGEADTLNLSYINSDDVYAIKCDDILQNYIGIRTNGLDKFMENMGVTDTSNIPDSITSGSISTLFDITEEQRQHIINTYSNVIQESISKDKYTKLGKNEITINNVKYNANAYKLELDESTLKQIVINCLTTLKDDNATLVVISNKFTTLGLSEEYTDITKLSEKINNALDQIQQDTSSEALNISITVYESAGKTLRTELELKENNKTSVNGSANNMTISTTESTYNLTIDKTIEDNTSRVNVIVSSNTGSENGTNTMQVTFLKNNADANIVNEITVIPDLSNTAQTVSVKTTKGALNTVSEITANISSDGININTIKSQYNQTLKQESQVNEIMELKNSNTIIANNYTIEQLGPFIERIGEKAGQVIPAKLAQLGLDVSSEDGIMKIAGITLSSAANIINANGFDAYGLYAIVLGGQVSTRGIMNQLATISQ